MVVGCGARLLLMFSQVGISAEFSPRAVLMPIRPWYNRWPDLAHDRGFAADASR